jgi:hypothetical protein
MSIGNLANIMGANSFRVFVTRHILACPGLDVETLGRQRSAAHIRPNYCYLGLKMHEL